MRTIQEINKRFIRRKWRMMRFSDKLKPINNGKVILNPRKMKCLKDSYKSSIWQLEIEVNQRKIPIILKISKQLRRPRPESTVERNIYRRARKVLQPFMPQIYLTKKNLNGHDQWVFMEYVEPLKGQVQYSPDHFKRIIPTLAKLHATTMNDRFKRNKSVFGDWLPRFDSEEMKQDRKRINKETLYYLEKAMKISDLRFILQPYYELLQKLLKKGPEYFPEVSKAGFSIIHGDLHTANMACNNVNEKEWNLKFIDWEGAKLAPCWYDIVHLIGIFLAYRRDWREQEDDITRRSVHLYADEMRKNGVEFHTDPVKLYQMAFLKRILERSLYLQLNWAVTGKKEAKLLRVYLDKIKVLGKQLGLY